MAKINYIIYSWYEYVCANRLVGVFLVALAISICTIVYIASHKPTGISDNKLTSITSELTAANVVPLVIYSLLISLLLLLPFTALGFMQFQTVFYSYSTLWQMAPVLPVSAMILTVIYTHTTALAKRHYAVIALILTTIILFICSNMGNASWKNKEFAPKNYDVSYAECTPLLSRLEQYAVSGAFGEELTILGPCNVTAYVHMYSGNIHTLYGKDMWDNSMKPYTYNEYPEAYNKLSVWMKCIEVYGTSYNIDDQSPLYHGDIVFDELETAIAADEAVGGVFYTNMAKENGVDIIVIYTDGNILDTIELDYITDTLKLKQEYISINDSEGYILLFL